MRWSIEFQNATDRADLCATSAKAWRIHLGDPATVETKKQLDAACKVASLLMKSGSLGDGGAFNIRLSGDANENHSPSPGMGPDGVCVVVTRAQV